MARQITEKLIGSYFKRENDNIKFNKHSAKKALTLPFSTKMEAGEVKNIYSDFKTFNGFVGEIFRYCKDEKLPKELLKNENFKKAVKDQTINTACQNTHFDPESNKIEDSQNKLSQLIDSLYFNDLDLVKYSYNAMPFLNWNYKGGNLGSGLSNMAGFFIEIFIDDEVISIINTIKDSSTTHTLHELLNKSLPKLESGYKKTKQADFIPFNTKMVELFKKDLRLLTRDKTSFLNRINQLIKFYYFSYVKDTSIELNSFLSPSKETWLYFTLESEAFSQTRRANKKGWKQLEEETSNLFSHQICLDILNHLRIVENPSNYKDIKQIFEGLSKADQEDIIEDIRGITTFYKENIPNPNDKPWSEFDSYFQKKANSEELTDQLEYEIIHLWTAIDYQFKYSQRNKPYQGFASWFTVFCKVNFLKNRGRNGYSLNLSSESLLFLTKLAIGNNEKIRLKKLWSEFKERGIEFDDSTQRTIIEFYEKINLIEKKSDSGDAQYVKAIL